MLEMLMQWYRRRFSDPEAIALLVILVAGFSILFFFSGLLAPLLVAIVLAYLLEWPTARLQAIGCSRRWAASIVLILFVGILLLMAFVVMPIAWQQGIYLIRDMPGMLNKLSDFAATLPRRYPALMDAGIIDAMAENMRTRMLNMGDSVVKYSLASLVGLLTLAVYLVLVPLMVFFLVKDKEQMLNAVRRVLPRNRGLAGQVWNEMNQQITKLYPRKSAGDGSGGRGDLAGLFAVWPQLFATVGGTGGLFGPDPLYRRLCGDNSGGGRRAVSVWPGDGILELFCRLSDYSGAGWQSAGTGTFLRSGEFASAGDYSVSGDFRRSVGFLGSVFRHSIGDAD
ncbi:permease PerM [Salmonella enterica subsp. enterica]|uniref:Permease PerM n=1 Tax=Salmonella enterica I TaxID=59201 RepID=A0A379WQY2_SALET|nr:permease PerM [Salmonella enterica subsp. enterica]